MGPKTTKESSFTLHDEEATESREAGRKSVLEAGFTENGGTSGFTVEQWSIWQDLQDDVK